MKRREFLASAVALGATGMAISETMAEAQDDAETKPRAWYELRQYHLQRGPKTELFDRFFREAALPALNRSGIEHVGVFSVAVGPDSPTMYVLLQHSTLESLALTRKHMDADAEFHRAGADFINAPANDPAYIRVDSSLMVAFEGMPKLEVPTFGQSRVFELRTYESHSLKANAKKVEMFNRGEIAIFRHAGFQPVFYGQGVIGARLPNLTYMLCAENSEAREKGWSAFGGSDEWRKLRSLPGYADPEIVGGITNVILRPTPYSQI